MTPTEDKSIVSQGFTIDNSSVMPIWLQIRGRIMHLINAGKLVEGDQLPSLRALAVELQVNMNTVSKVYHDLQRDGYIVSQKSKGLYVSKKADANISVLEDSYRALAEEFCRRCLSSGMNADDVIDLIERTLKTIS